MNPIREKLLRTKALEEMDKNANIENVIADINFTLDFEGSVNYGGTTATGPKYRNTSESWAISREDVLDINQCNDLTNWVNNNYSDYEKNIFYDYKDIVGSVYINPEIYFKVSHYGEESSWVKNNVKISRKYYYEPLIQEYKFSGECYLEPTSESIDIRPTNFEDDFQMVESGTFNEGQLGSLVVEFLSEEKPWVDATFGQFQSEEDSMKVPILLNETEFIIEFDKPDDISSPIWDLVSVFDYEDPWNLQDERLQLTLHPLCISSSSYHHNFIHIRDYKENREYSRIEKMKMRLF